MNPKPQISQMGADGFFNFFICENLCHLWLNHLSADDEDLKAIEELEKDLKRKGKGK